MFAGHHPPRQVGQDGDAVAEDGQVRDVEDR